MLGGGGVDGAIHRAAGPQLVDECKRVGPCPTGSARITGGYLLPAKFVIHAVGPVWMGGSLNEDELLASCYRAALDLAVRHELRTLAFPAISCGIFGYPLDRACGIAVKTLREGLEQRPQLDQVLIAVIDPKVERAMREACAPS